MEKLDRPFLVGEKVHLRPLDLDDIDREYLNWVNDGEVIANLAFNFPTTKEDLENYVKTNLGNPNFVFFAIIEKRTNKHIGNMKLGRIDWVARTSNFGTMLGDKNSWGKGYATDAKKLLVKYAFEKLNMHKMFDLSVKSNIASIKANQKAGFHIEAELKSHLFKNGKYEDAVVLSLFAEDYFQRTQKEQK